MSIIGADAAKLAGLQIDLLTKFRAGQLSLDHLDRFLNLSPEVREERFGDIKGSKPAPTIEAVEKFGLLVDLGIIEVPADYVHGARLAEFKKKCQGGRKKLFYSYDGNINDVNFSNPSLILKPGNRLWVRAFHQIVSGTTTSKERVAFSATQNAKNTGAQGLSLVFDQKRDQLLKGKWYASFDEEKRLWEDTDRDHRVPGVFAHSGGDFYFNLGDFEDVWDQDDAFLCFCDVPLGT